MPILVSKRAARPPPERAPEGALVFRDRTDFRPNLTPAEVLQLGSFGGGYFRTIRSSVTGEVHTRAWQEFPKEWFEGLDVATQVASDQYRPAANRYGVRSGKTLNSKDAFGLAAWEQAGWIIEQDPYGWFQWYCRFFLGRRSMDDDRQVGRWAAMCGDKGRWKRNLIARCIREGKAHDDVSCAPVVRQTLQHWAYRLTEADFSAYRSEIAAGATTPFMPSSSMPPVTLDGHDSPSAPEPQVQGESSRPAVSGRAKRAACPEPRAGGETPLSRARAKRAAPSPAPCSGETSVRRTLAPAVRRGPCPPGVEPPAAAKKKVKTARVGSKGK